MQTFTEFFEKFSTNDMDQMILDYERLRTDGTIGDCFLRTSAREWESVTGQLNNIVLIMRDLTFESYRVRYNQLMSQQNGTIY